MSEKPSLTALFITLNEEYHIGAAIDNVKDIAEEIFVVDSGSTDKTVQIAESKGAKVLYHPFEGFGAQWNFALSLPIMTAWTMKMDPDERLSEELKAEIVSVLSANESCSIGYSFERVLWFMGRRLKGVKGLEERIWRTGQCRFTDVSVNEHPIIVGRWVQLKGLMDHYDSKNLEDWLNKQNRYTTQEAKIRASGGALALNGRLFGSRLERRMWVKRIFYSLPGRYILWFLYCYFWLGAWKSGSVGYAWAQMRVMVMQLTEYKWKEMQWAQKRI